MKRIEMMAAPTGMQPGGYVPVAYADRTKPATPGSTPPAQYRVAALALQ